MIFWVSTNHVCSWPVFMMCSSVPSVSKPGNSGTGRRSPVRVEPQRRRSRAGCGCRASARSGPSCGCPRRSATCGRGLITRRPPALCAIAIIRPSTCAGTPLIIVLRRIGPAAPASCARTSSWLPPMPPEVTSTRRRAQLELADLARGCSTARARTSRPLEHAARDAVDGAVSDAQLVDAVAEAQLDEPARGGRADAAHERLDHAGPGAPGDVEARHRVAVADRSVAAALGPADVRQQLHALLAQPRPLLAGGEVDVRLRPAPRPEVLVGRSKPAVPSQSCQASSCESLDAHPPLLGAVDEEQPAERPERLAAERALRLLLEQDHAPAGVGQLGRRDQPGEPGADHDRVGVCSRAHPLIIAAAGATRRRAPRCQARPPTCRPARRSPATRAMRRAGSGTP